MASEKREYLHGKFFGGKAGFVSLEWFSDFVYMQDKFGRAYGWGVAKYSTPEELFGYEAVTAAYKREPFESKERILVYLSGIFPEAAPEQIWKFIK